MKKTLVVLTLFLLATGLQADSSDCPTGSVIYNGSSDHFACAYFDNDLFEFGRIEDTAGGTWHENDTNGAITESNPAWQCFDCPLADPDNAQCNTRPTILQCYDCAWTVLKTREMGCDNKYPLTNTANRTCKNNAWWWFMRDLAECDNEFAY